MCPRLLSAGLPLGSFAPGQHSAWATLAITACLRVLGPGGEAEERRGTETSETQSIARAQRQGAKTGCREGAQRPAGSYTRGLSLELGEDVLAKTEAPP